MCLVENFGRSTVEYKRLQSLVVVATFLAAGEELTVGECTRAASTKGVVRVGIDLQITVNERNIALARQHLLASLQKDGLQSKLDES